MKKNFVNYSIFVWWHFLDAVWICHSTAFWPPIALMLAYMWWAVVLLQLSWLFVGLGHNNLTMIWRDVDLFVFIIFGFCWTQMCRVTLLKNQIWKFMAIICSNNLSVSSFLPVSFPVGRCCCTWSFEVQVSEALYILLLSFFFLHFGVNNFNSPIFKFMDSFFYLSKHVLETLSMFFTSIIVLLRSRFLSGFFLYFISPYWNSLFVHTSFPWLPLTLSTVSVRLWAHLR